MFSSAGSVFVSKSYADAKQNKRINQPCLNLYASSTPERLLGALASGNVEDGFVGRFLFVPGETNPSLLGLGDAEASHQMLDGIRHILKARKFYAEPGDGDLARFFEIKPRTIPYGPEAWPLVENLQKLQDARMNASSELIRPIVARGLEHIIKIALTICNDKVVTKEDILWATEFVTYCQSWLISRIQEVLASGDPALLEEVILGFIEARGGQVTDQDLAQIPSYSKAKLRVRKEARDSLLDKGIIQRETLYLGATPIPGYQIRSETTTQDSI